MVKYKVVHKKHTTMNVTVFSLPLSLYMIFYFSSTCVCFLTVSNSSFCLIIKKKKKNAHSVCERCAIQRLTDYSAKTLKNKKKNKKQKKKKTKTKNKQTNAGASI